MNTATIIVTIILLAIIVMSMQKFLSGGTGIVILKKELKSIFYSPIAWIIMALVMLLNGFSFTAALEILRKADVDETIIGYTFSSTSFWLTYFFIFPVITMRLFSEEKKLGTIETLLTAPVQTIHLLIAKYLAALVFYFVIWLPSAVNFFLFRISSADNANAIGSLLGAYAIIFLVGVFNISIGCLASALTKNQLVAAMACFTFCMLHFLVGFILQDLPVPESWQGSLFYFSTVKHVQIFISGLIDSRQFIYYLSFTILILSFTYNVLEYRKWKT
ncbi:MAG: ABC transporter permease subunit [Akkermansiaceae bacterium]|jgi:ABC-2 type transport system permease protein|nr:ABC transporter permease subunit [Akkermansiaceae bacterium]MDG1854067.1 ABC transporter permease [Verrucomicrobiales bacterium]